MEAYKEAGEKQFRNKITFFSFWLAFGVIKIHTYNVESYALLERTDLFSRLIVFVEKWERELQNICVPFFFIISGYLFFRTFEMKKIFYKYRTRVRTILIPYIIWCSIYYIYMCVLSHIPQIGPYINNGEAIPFTLSAWFDWVGNNSYYTLWFLKDLILFIMFTPVIYVLLKNHQKFLSGLVVIIVLLFTPIVFRNKMDIDVNSLTLYCCGAYVGINHKEIPKIQQKWLMSGARIVVIIFLLINMLFIDEGIFSNIYAQIVMCISLWYAVGSNLFVHDLQWWYTVSFYIYCIHDIFLEAIEKLFFIIFGNGSIFALMDYLLAPVITVILCILSAAILKKYCPVIWGVLTGGR